MSYTLIISEKREAAERIARALDDNGSPSRLEEQGIPYFEAYHNSKKLLIVPAIGHLYTIAPEGKSGFHYPVLNVKWTAAFLFNKKLAYTKRWINVFSKLSEEASSLISGTDCDIEGEVIGYTILKYACGGREDKAKRMVFSTLTTDELRSSYRNASQGINFKLAEAGETRHIVDFLWGINLSRALTLAVKNSGRGYTSLSTGRVQAPTLKFLVEREKEIKSFEPVLYWKIHTKVKIGEHLLDVEYERSRINNEIDAKNIVEKCSRQKGSISDIAVRTSRNGPPVPFDLGSLQAESYRLFGYNPSLTLRVAERLYLEALISYPRTSSQKIPPTIKYREVLSSLGRANEYRVLIEKLLANKKLRPNEGDKQDPAHPAIYPTGNLPEDHLDPISRRIFDLVVRRFMAVFGNPAVRESIRVSIMVNGETFYLEGVRTMDEGWLEFYRPFVRSEEVILPSLSVGREVLFSDVHCVKEYTSPPPRYNPSSLLKLMEEQNIGTKATRAEIIDTLYKRGYAVDERMAVTELGFKVVETLEKYCQRMMSIEFTRTLEERMEKIESGVEREGNVIEDSVNELRTILTEFKANEEQIGLELSDAVKKVQMEKIVIGQCPICKTGNLLVLSSRKTGKRFAGCTNFSKGLCSAAFPLPQPPYRIKLLRKICKTCSWPLIAVSSKGRRLWNLCLNSNCPTKKSRMGK
ncbi:MAG: DNA topoisomerase I [Candidatus Bathyarchaeota archaeon]